MLPCHQCGKPLPKPILRKGAKQPYEFVEVDGNFAFFCNIECMTKYNMIGRKGKDYDVDTIC